MESGGGYLFLGPSSGVPLELDSPFCFFSKRDLISMFCWFVLITCPSVYIYNQSKLAFLGIKLTNKKKNKLKPKKECLKEKDTRGRCVMLTYVHPQASLQLLHKRKLLKKKTLTAKHYKQFRAHGKVYVPVLDFVS